MLFPQAHYEIEFRCRFKNDEEAYQVLPFLKPSLVKEYLWVDNYYGLEIYRSGQVLREGHVNGTGGTRYHLGWKGPDTGAFANIRREVDEYLTREISDSAVMAYFCKEKRAYSAGQIGPALERAGYPRFMSYQGHSLTGRDEALAVNTKLMHCQMVRWPILVELEKIAPSKTEAAECQLQLACISRDYKLESRLVKEEPGTLLYQKVFGG